MGAKMVEEARARGQHQIPAQEWFKPDPQEGPRSSGSAASLAVAGSDVFKQLRSGTGVLKVAGKEVARQTMERTLPIILQWDENFDIGADTGTPVSEEYQVPFRFTGKLNKLTLTIDRPKLTPGEAQRDNRMSE
jgi:arylsulfatase